MYQNAKQTVIRIRSDRCRYTAHIRAWPTPAAVWPSQRWNRVQRLWRMRADARTLSNRCIPTDPEGIIRYVFPDWAEEQAIRVAMCESDHGVMLVPNADNPSSTASGLFQLLDTWWAGRFNPFDPLANTRAAYSLWLSSGGSFSQHWAASIGCWS